MHNIIYSSSESIALICYYMHIFLYFVGRRLQHTVTLLPQEESNAASYTNGSTKSLWTCNASRSRASMVWWLVNGTHFNDMPTPPEEVTEFLYHNETSGSDGVVSDLTIPHIPYYNNSIIKCCIQPQNFENRHNCSNEQTFLYSDGGEWNHKSF